MLKLIFETKNVYSSVTRTLFMGRKIVIGRTLKLIFETENV